MGNHGSEKDTNYETSPPGFTAVNGQDSGPNGVSSANDSPRTTDSTIKVGGDYRETRGIIHPSSRPPTPSNQPEDNNHEMTNGTHREHRQSASHDSSPTLHKRKRSQSDDGDTSSSSNSRYNQSPSQAEPHLPQSHGRYYGSAPPDSTTRNSSREVGVASETRHSHGPNGSNGHMHSHVSPWNDRGQAPPSNHHPHGRHLEQSEAILREALQRDSQLHDTPNRSWGLPTRSEGDSGDGEQYGHYSQDGTPTATGQGNPKRKRVFSNRTKTGCLTCRRRKKKCDEGQPQCKSTPHHTFTFASAILNHHLQVTIASVEAFNVKVIVREVRGRNLSTPRLQCPCSRRMVSLTLQILCTKPTRTLQDKAGLPSTPEKACKRDPSLLTTVNINFTLSSPPVQLRLAHGLMGRTPARPGPTPPTLLIYQIAVNQNKNISHPSRRLPKPPTNLNIVQWPR